jgi:XTP/dITP diphosphohydrolase
MINLYIGTSNPGKLKEYQNLLKDLSYKFDIQSITDLEVDEPYDTLTENAFHKATEYSLHVNGLVLAEDSGFFVHSLSKLPGVYSARFYNSIIKYNKLGYFYIAGHYKNPKINAEDINNSNIEKVLRLLECTKDRRCYYHTTICIADKGKVIKTFHGKCDGIVSKKSIGNGGFGYDSIFIPSFEIKNSVPKTFAELKDINQNITSARGNASILAKDFLNQNF